MNHPDFLQRRLLLSSMLSSLVAAGCMPIPAAAPENSHDREPAPDRMPEPSSGPAAASGSADASDEPWRRRLDRVLEDGYRRELRVADNGAWQVLHGVLAYGTACLVTVEDRSVPAVEYLLGGGALQGWDPQRGDMVGEPPQRGIRFELEVASLRGQGHRDQWLAILSQCSLPLSTPLVLGETTYTLESVLLQALWDVPRNFESEFSWTLIGVTAYRGTDFSWSARDGSRWSVERLVDAETQAPRDTAACGGTHRMSSLAFALRRHLEQGGTRSGVWGAAEERIAEAIADARRYQNGDGSFSSIYLARYGWSPDLSDVLRTTGHVLEFLAGAGDDDLLREAWIRAAAERLCGVLEATRGVDLECGALYHALHGLLLYRQRLFPDQPWTAPLGAASNS